MNFNIAMYFVPPVFLHVSVENVVLRDLFRCVCMLHLHDQVHQVTFQPPTVHIVQTYLCACPRTGEKLLYSEPRHVVLESEADVYLAADLQFQTTSYHALVYSSILGGHLEILVSGNTRLVRVNYCLQSIALFRTYILPALQSAQNKNFRVLKIQQIEAEPSNFIKCKAPWESVRTGELFFTQQGLQTFLDGVFFRKQT